jgi:MFS transporter, ACS family, D-galactonate transporter
MTGRLVGLLLVHAALVHFNRISLSVAGSERLMAQFGISEQVMGAVYSAYLVAYTIMMTPGGWFIDRYGPRASILIVGVGSAACVGLTGLSGLSITSGATLVAVLIGIRILMGIANAPFHPSAAHTISRWIPAPRRAWVNGLVNAAALVGISSTFYLFGFLMDRLGWPGAFLLAAGVTGLATLAWGRCAADRPAEAPTRTVAARDDVPPWRKRSLILLTISYAAVGYFQYLFFYWMQHYFNTVLGLGKSSGRLYATIPTVAMAVGMAAGGWLTDLAQSRWGGRRGRTTVTVFSMMASAAFLAAGILCREPAWIVTCFSFALALLGACEGAFWTTAVDLGGRQGGLAAAIVNTGGNAGGALAPYLTPLISTHFGWPAGMGVACIICFLGAVNWLWIDPDEGRPSEPLRPAPAKAPA